MATAHDFLTQALKFREVARTFHEPGYGSQAVSNAVHAVIAANDAVCTHLVGERPGGQSHGEATRALRRACKGTEWEREAPQRAQPLAQVVQHKNASQYEGTPLTADVADRVMKQTERFIDWAQTVLSPDAASGAVGRT